MDNPLLSYLFNVFLLKPEIDINYSRDCKSRSSTYFKIIFIDLLKPALNDKIKKT